MKRWVARLFPVIFPLGLQEAPVAVAKLPEEVQSQPGLKLQGVVPDAEPTNKKVVKIEKEIKDLQN